MKTLITLAALLLITGCSAFNGLSDYVTGDGVQAADEALDAAQHFQCRVATVGSVKRKYQTEADRAAYNQMCGDELP